MKCLRCGKEVEEGTKYCNNCGFDVESQKNYRVLYKEVDPELEKSQNRLTGTNFYIWNTSDA